MTAFSGAGGSLFNTTAGNKAFALAGATANDLLVVVCALTGATTAPTITDDQSGTYTEVSGGGFLQGSSANKIWVFVRNALVPLTQSTTVTMTSPGGDSGGGMTVYRLTGMSRTGSAAVRQAAGQANQAAGTPAPAFSSAALTGNSTIGAILNSTNPATMTPNASWTEKHDLGYNVPTTGLETCTRDSGFTGTTVTWGSSSASVFASVIVEFDASAAGTNWQQPVTDSVTPSDAVAFGRGLEVDDTATPSDAVAFDRGLVVADNPTLADAITANRGINVTPADSVTMSDTAPTIQTGKGVTLADTVTPADGVTFDRGLALADNPTLADAVAFQRAITQSDAVTPSDLVALGRGLTIADNPTLTDLVTLGRGTTITDTVTLTDQASTQLVSASGAVPIFTPFTRGYGPAGDTDTLAPSQGTHAQGASGRSGTIGVTGRTEAHA